MPTFANNMPTGRTFRSPRTDFGSVIGGPLGNAAVQAAQQRSQLSTLSFSRDQEYQADTLGLQYMITAGYDPAGASGMLAALTPFDRTPIWSPGPNQSSDARMGEHSSPEPKPHAARARRRAAGRAGSAPAFATATSSYGELEGVYVDDDPAQGVIEGATFTHPDLRIQFTVPQGYLMSNGADAVTISGSAGKAQFRGGAYSGSLDRRDPARISTAHSRAVEFSCAAAAAHDDQRDGGGRHDGARRNQLRGPSTPALLLINGMPRRVYYFVMLTPGGYGVGPFAPMINSLRRITPAEAASIRRASCMSKRCAPGTRSSR